MLSHQGDNAMRHAHLVIGSILTLGLALGLAGCQKTETQDGAQVVRIGSVAPLTGPQAHIGKDNDNGARLAVEEITPRA